MAEFPVLNRELSWIEFNARVLQEGLKPSVPLLERLNFLSIVSSNFDEFFMVKVAALKSAMRRGERHVDASRESPASLLDRLCARVREIIAAQYGCVNTEIFPALAEEGIVFPPSGEWSQAERRYLESYFLEEIFPLCTPLRIEEDAFPSAGNLKLHCAFELEGGENGPVFALVQVPANSNRFVRLPQGDLPAAAARYALAEDLVISFAQRFFPGHRIQGSIVFQVTRDADSGVDEDRQEDFLAAMEEVLAGRQNSTPVRLSVSGRNPPLVRILQKGLGLEDQDTYIFDGPLCLPEFHSLATSLSPRKLPRGSRDRTVYKPWIPVRLEEESGTSVWEEIERSDRLVHLPYESFDSIQRFLDEAADDPSVLAIKMTLYRTSGESPVVKALIRAARNGKQVAVVVELKARFDEERNITWASTLEQAGAIVTYGVARLKVHAKAALVIRKAKGGSIRKYLHLSTGNYNDRTAKVYSDLSIFTANTDLCNDASIFFNMLTGYSTIQPLKHLAVAPFDLKRRILDMIDREIQRSTPESPGLIIAKLNALSDTDMIAALYAASRAGVRIQLNVRSACTLVPGIPGVSGTIEVRSVLGRYLEHGRMLYFRNGGMDEMYLTSADWLPRNLDRRIELMFPVLDEGLKRQCRQILDTYFRDNEHSYRMMPDGAWQPLVPAEGEKKVYAQQFLYARAKRLAEIAEAPPEQLHIRRRFKYD